MRRFAAAWMVPVTAAIGGLWAALPERGLNLWALWQLESAEAFRHWGDAGTAEAMAGAFAGPQGLFPFVGWAAAWLFDGDMLFLGLRFLGALAAFATLWVTGAWARRAAGTVAGVGAVVALALTPRFQAAAQVPGPTIFALATVMLAVFSVLRARTERRWFAAALPLCVVAMATSLVGWVVWLPLVWLVLSDPQGPRVPGQVRVRAVPLELVLLPLLAICGLVIVTPWFHDGGAEKLGEMLALWLERPPEPALYFGRIYGLNRLAWTAPPVMWALQLPVIVTFAAAIGLALGGRQALRDQRVLLIAAWLLPLAMRSFYFAGTDVLVFGCVPLAVMAGVGVERAAAAARRTAGFRGPRGAYGVAAVALVVVGATWETAPSREAPEAFYNRLIGGTDGAVDRGLSRYPHGPVPRALFDDHGVSGAVAVLSNDWEYAPVLRRYEAWGWAPPLTRAAVGDADWLILVYDDALPELYHVVVDFENLRASGAEVRTVRVAGVPLVTAARFPR